MKSRLSGTTLAVMGWLEPPSSPKGLPTLHSLWAGPLAVQKKKGRGFYREVGLLEQEIEATMRALEAKLDTLDEKSHEFKALHSDSERLRMLLAELE